MLCEVHARGILAGLPTEGAGGAARGARRAAVGTVRHIPPPPPLPGTPPGGACVRCPLEGRTAEKDGDGVPLGQ